jgi:hypothetical protein
MSSRILEGYGEGSGKKRGALVTVQKRIREEWPQPLNTDKDVEESIDLGSMGQYENFINLRSTIGDQTANVDDEARQAMRIMERALTTQLATLQRGYIETPLNVVQGRENSVIAAVHYLYICVCIYMHGASVGSYLEDSLNTLFEVVRSPVRQSRRLEPALRSVFEKFAEEQSLPEIVQLVEICEDIFSNI